LSKKAESHTTPSAFAVAAKAIIEMEMMGLSARLVLLEDLATMNDEENTECLFHILDKDRDNYLSVVELADGLRKINGDVGFEESLALAMDRVARFDHDKDAKLDFAEFQEYVTQLVEGFDGASFHDLAEMLILSVVFSDRGNDEEENLTASIAEETITRALKEQEALVEVMKDTRMKALFHLFDLDADGSVDYPEVVMGLYKITEDLAVGAGKADVAMSLYDDEGNDLLDYEELSSRPRRQQRDPDNMTKDEVMRKIKELIDAEQGNY
jgi:hypothetical protein